MTEDRWQQVKELFHAAAALPPDEREALLRERCGDDAELLREARALLASHREDDGAGDPTGVAPGTGALTAKTASRLHGLGRRVGPYTLLRVLGEGGMGVVYLAERSEPIQQTVALKLVRAGLETPESLARFDAERRALALMNHPNVASVFDAGVDEDGRPYFVMEYVPGQPITAFCDAERLSVRRRLEMFTQVCDAVQHAHTKGVIHRDLKPNNVLVALYDGKPIPKVIDFGVAKATGQNLTDHTTVTGFGDVIGTPQYMSPEQAELNQLDVDTRSDVYSLGVLLYELLTGSTPLERQRVRDVALMEVLRVVREEEPPKPSVRLTATEELPSIAACRDLDPKKLSGHVRGELDWIVMRALEKDRARRYQTASGLAADVQRYLHDEAVHASPPSAAYRFRKFARRNKRVLVTASLLGVMLLAAIGGVAGSVGWAVRDRTARQAKVAGQVELILSEVERLESEQKWAEALVAVRRAEAVVAGGGADAATAARVRELLKDLEFIDRLEQIRMRQSMIANRIDRIAQAHREYAQAFREYGVDVESLPVEAAIERLKARTALTIPIAAALDDWVAPRYTRADWVAATPLVAIARGIDPEPLRDTLRSMWVQGFTRERHAELRRLVDTIDLRAQHPATLGMVAHVPWEALDRDAAHRVLREAQHLHPGDYWLNYHLAKVLSQRNDKEGAIRYLTAAIAVRPNSASAHSMLGSVLNSQQMVDEAIACYRKAIELDPEFEGAHMNLGSALQLQNKVDEAITCYRKFIELHPKSTATRYALGRALQSQKKLDEAITCYRQAIALHPQFETAHVALGGALQLQNKVDEAITCYRKCIELLPKSARTHYALGYALQSQKKMDEAITCYRQAIAVDPEFESAYVALGGALQLQNKVDEAITCYRKSIELNPKSVATHHVLGQALQSQKKMDEAITCYRKSIELDPANPWHLYALGHALRDSGRIEEAIEAYRQAVRVNPDQASSHRVLGEALEKAGKSDEAAAAWREYERLAVGKLRETLRANPGDAAARRALARCLNEIAWRLITHAEPAQRDPTHGVTLAKEAVALVPDAADAWNTLGVALYRCGNCKEAIVSLEKFRDLRTTDGEWSNPFFLAMAHWQLGNKDEARVWRDRAITWMDARKPPEDSLRRYRAEMDELMRNEPDPQKPEP